MVIFTIALVGRAASLWADEMFQGYEVNHFSYRQAKIFRTSEVLLGMIIALLTKDVIWVAASHTLIWAAQGARGLFLVNRYLQPLVLRWQWPEIRVLLIASIPLLFGSIFEALMRQGGILLYRGAGAADELVGNFAITLQALMILSSLFAALSKAALPAVSRSVARRDTKHRIYVSVMIRSAFVFGTLAAVWALAIGADIVNIVLGARFQIAGEWLWLMLWLLVPYIIEQAANNTLVAHGNYGRATWLSFIGVVSVAGGVLLLLGPYGFPGVIAGMLIGFSVYATVALLVIVRMRLIEHAEDIPKLAVIVTLTVLVYLALAGYRPWLAAIVGTMVLFLGLILLGVVRETERKAILNLVLRRA
jgi:O-antigen/teichoic acid export membrane protein